jgi:hypothetical protein
MESADFKTCIYQVYASCHCFSVVFSLKALEVVHQQESVHTFEKACLQECLQQFGSRETTSSSIGIGLLLSLGRTPSVKKLGFRLIGSML